MIANLSDAMAEIGRMADVEAKLRHRIAELKCKLAEARQLYIETEEKLGRMTDEAEMVGRREALLEAARFVEHCVDADLVSMKCNAVLGDNFRNMADAKGGEGDDGDTD